MRINKFVRRWKNHGYEKGETQTFWLNFLRDVFNISNPEDYINFEVPVKLQHTNFIDAFLIDTKVIIEQKSFTENFSAIKPFEQAQRYGSSLPYSMRPRWIVVCNFVEFFIYDMETLAEPKKILLEELPQKFHDFDFMIDPDKTSGRIELELSLKAGEIVGRIYDALKSQYVNPNSAESLQSLNKLCVRLVFCLYAESTGVFGKHKIFHDYLNGSRNIRRDLLDLFDVLNTPIDERNPYLADELKIFPYVNGGLFADDEIEIPNFTPEIKNLLLEEASSNFNWSGISPTIFGAVFESTLNPITRRAGGMHYTSVDNIHKVIDPLFLDNLRADFVACKKNRRKLLALQNKIADLKFFDPACGSGNFLTESFISLRKLENEILKELLGTQIQLGELSDPIKVSINQFFGIEINDFAVAVAQTALWIAELQMKNKTQDIINRDLDLLPLKSYAHIIKGNALTIDWMSIFQIKNDATENSILNSQFLIPNYIMGNPPFVGHQWRTSEQVDDMKIAFHDLPKHGKLDYVCAWYNKAADFILDKKISAAFVSTNSICQGESVGILWKFLFDKGIKINFAYRNFKWFSESFYMAHVHCVIIGFAAFDLPQKFIFDGDKKIFAQNINGYLLDAPNIFIENRGNPPIGFPKMTKGSQPTDGGNLILSESDKISLLKKFPDAEKFVKPFIGAEEFINGKIRYCLWLVDANPSEIRKCPPIMERVKKVAEFRKTSKTKSVRAAAATPTVFTQIRQSKNNFLAIPRVSSEKRKFIPIEFFSPEIILSESVLMIDDANLFLFGILTSSIHMAWMRIVSGRLEMRYRYTPAIYNNFPFPKCEEKAVKKIELAAQKILDVRKKYSASTLADLYDELVMPAELRKAHNENDAAVMSAYGFAENLSEGEIVAALMRMKNEELRIKN